jgi:hypothetical protein
VVSISQDNLVIDGAALGLNFLAIVDIGQRDLEVAQAFGAQVFV